MFQDILAEAKIIFDDDNLTDLTRDQVSELIRESELALWRSGTLYENQAYPLEDTLIWFRDEEKDLSQQPEEVLYFVADALGLIPDDEPEDKDDDEKE